MPVKTLIKPSEYHDSVSLMLVARELARLPGVADAAVVMATEANKGILRDAGLLTPESEAAAPNDLVIAVGGEDEALAQALVEANKLLQKKAVEAESADYRPRTLRSAVKSNPSANVAVISVAGRYAADEAWQALHKGLHVLLFSDNVSLADEIALKRYASQNGLLLMGPGAGTAILNGVALGFANVLPQGPVGIVSAAGTGLQEVSTLLAKAGCRHHPGHRHRRARPARGSRRDDDAGRTESPARRPGDRGDRPHQQTASSCYCPKGVGASRPERQTDRSVLLGSKKLERNWFLCPYSGRSCSPGG